MAAFWKRTNTIECRNWAPNCRSVLLMEVQIAAVSLWQKWTQLPFRIRRGWNGRIAATPASG